MCGWSKDTPLSSTISPSCAMDNTECAVFDLLQLRMMSHLVDAKLSSVFVKKTPLLKLNNKIVNEQLGILV